MNLYIRTCQTCLNRVISKEPKDNERLLNQRCKKCKSFDFDYGSNQNVDPITLKDIPYDNDDE